MPFQFSCHQVTHLNFKKKCQLKHKELTDILTFAVSSGAVGIIVSKIFEIGQRLFDGKRGEIELSHKCGDKEFSWKYPVTSKKDIEQIKAEFEEKIRKECGKNIILLK